MGGGGRSFGVGFYLLFGGLGVVDFLFGGVCLLLFFQQGVFTNKIK